jgi:hypothetical protein
VGLERCPLSLVSTIQELLGRKDNGWGSKTEITAVGIRRADYATPLYPQATSCGRLVGILRSRTQAMEFVLFVDCRSVVNKASVPNIQKGK